MRIAILCAAFLGLAVAAHAEDQKPAGTGKGAAAGAVAGHELGSGHAASGAAVGGAIGHHQKKKAEESGQNKAQ